MGVGSWLSFRFGRMLVKDERIYLYASAVVVGGLIAARLGHIADNTGYYAARPDQLVAFWNGGIAVTAAPIGSAIGGWLACRGLRLPLGFMFDITVIGIALGEAIGRLGDIVNGEHHAAACAGLPWCVRYTSPLTLGQQESVHPIAAYDLLIVLGIFTFCFLLWRRIRGHPPEGRVFWTYLVLYGAARFVTSFLRLDPVLFAGLQEGQLLGLLYLAVGIPALIRLGSAGAAGPGRPTTITTTMR